MSDFTEGQLHIRFPDSATARKFDENHPLSHCMKAVDFIVELEERVLFVEFKDPDHTKSTLEAREDWVKRFLGKEIDVDLKYKYRDSFLYEWASGRADKPIYYYVLVALETLDEAQLLTRTDRLKTQLPIPGPMTGMWKKNIVSGCAVFNLAAWNNHLPDFPVMRMTP
ncbi:MAG: hypothetical protein OEW12_08120 [Deltaproteobacteria bacterium]|nr:hypothetical protein [Deltaproteobacteria bacterium]